MSALVSALSTVFWGLLLLSVLASVHEAGHFLAARACGMRVTEFFLGIPCRLKLSRRSASRGTEVGVTPILLGGYTRICGMEAEPPACADRVLAAVAGLGRASVERIADEAGVSFDEALDALEVLSDWGSVEPYFDEAAGEKPGQRTWPAQFQTVPRVRASPMASVGAQPSCSTPSARGPILARASSSASPRLSPGRP